MLFCPVNETFTEIWVDHGLTHCFIDTISSAFLFTFIAICGGIEYGIYRRYGTPVDNRLLRKSNLFKFQLFLSIVLSIEVILRLVLEATVTSEDKTIYGFMILRSIFTFLIWPMSVVLVLTERFKALPSSPTSGHGLILLIFWTLVFMNENLAFLNWNKKLWWFDRKSLSSEIELALFVTRYCTSLLLFVLGIKAPGLPSFREYFIYSRHLQVENQVLIDNENPQPSAIGNFFRKMKLLLPFIWPKKNCRLQFQVFTCLLLLVFGRVTNVFVPIINKKIINSLTPTVPGESLTYRWDYILIFVAFWFFQGQGASSFLSNLRSYLWIRVQQYTVKEIQVELYSHLHRLSLRWHISRKTGEVLRIMDRGTNSVLNLLSYILFNILPTIADILIAIVYFTTSFNAWFGLIVFVAMSVYLTVTILVTEWRNKFRRAMNKQDNATEAKAVDALLNFETVKYYNAEDYEIEAYRHLIDLYQVTEWKASASLNFLNTIQSFVISVAVMAGSLLCAHMVVSGEGLSVGDYVLFSTYILQLYTPLNFFGTYYRMIQTAFIDMENMFDLLNVVPDIKDINGALPLKVSGSSLEFRNVSFSYLPEKQVLKNISFEVPSGKTVALVGASGGGKSTIIRLIFRLYECNSGEILFDGQNIRNVQQKSLRSQIGVVPQDTVLFNDTIRYNIHYGRVTANDDEIEEAAKVADIHRQILTFPKCYDTIVGERGLKLSGGEKQRVAIARTVLKNPSIVLLDEATSALDTHTERNIQSALGKMCANRTTVIVAHRLSTIIHADIILVLQEGEILERGKHEELIELGGIYANMWQQQQQKAEEVDESNKLSSTLI